MSKARSVTFGWQFAVPVDRIWSVLADTARFNEAAGFPGHEIKEIPQPDGSVNFVAHANLGPLTVTWDDEPQNWVTNRWFRHCIRFRNGPLNYLCVTFRLRPNGGGSHGEYTIEIKPANFLGRFLLGPGLFKRIYEKFTTLFSDAEAYCEGWRETKFEFTPPALPNEAARQAEEIVEHIEPTRHGHDLAHKLVGYVITRPTADVESIRPLALARLWDVPERHAIEVCLEAVRQGLLGLRWSLLCPRCQCGKDSVAALRDLPAGAHCATCNIDFELNFSQNVELVFHPATTIRKLDHREYCLMGPMSTPHILAQLSLAASEQRTESVQLTPGLTYRIRTLEPGDECNVTYAGGSFPEVIAERNTITTGGPVTVGMVAFINRSQRRLTFILEELTWRRDALIAHRATTIQAFRDLFNDDILRPGDDVEIDSISFLFTDLKGSTAMYDQIGDAQAYVLVQEHFDMLGDAVREHDGSIVKKIGDAVMAVFFSPADALNCAIRIQHDIHWFNQTSDNNPIIVKLGLHTGRCLLVNLNDQLDYCGSAVNMAARLQGQSCGGDIVMSSEFADHPEVVSVLDGYSPVRETVELTGFSKPVPFWRITAGEFTAHREPRN
jgi:class 3 adenylate cyclase